RRPLRPTRFPYTTLFRSLIDLLQQDEVPGRVLVITLGRASAAPADRSTGGLALVVDPLHDLRLVLVVVVCHERDVAGVDVGMNLDRKSTRLNSSHVKISY